MDLTLPDNVSPEVAAVLQKDDVKAVIATLIEQAKSPLITKRDDLLGQLTTFKQQLAKVEELGGLQAITDLAEQARTAAEAKRQAELLAAEKDGNAEVLKKHYGDQLSAKEQELATLRQTIIDEKVSNKLSAAIREAKGVPELLEPHLRNRIRAELKDGKVAITVLAPNGVPMLKDDGKEANLGDLINELKGSPIFQRAFEAPGTTGSGARPSGSPSSTNPWNPASRNLSEQMKVYRQDPALAKRLAAEFNVALP